VPWSYQSPFNFQTLKFYFHPIFAVFKILQSMEDSLYFYREQIEFLNFGKNTFGKI